MLAKIKPQINYRKNYQNKSFKGQDLSNADFSNCDIRGADFTNANLTGANFSNATAGLANRRAKIVLAIGFVTSIIAAIGAGLGAYFTFRFISLRKGDNIPFPLGLTFLLLLLLTEIIILRFIKRQGIQEAMKNIFVFLVIAVPVNLVLASLASSRRELFKGLVGFRITALIRAIAEPDKARAPAVVIVHLLLGVGSILLLTAALSVGVVILATVTKPQVVNLAVIATAMITAIGCGLTAENRTGRLPEYVPHIAFIIAAGLIAIFLFTFAYPIAKRTLAGDEKHAILHQIAVFICTFFGTSFRRANLTDANFSNATLKSTDLRKANTTKTLWKQAKHLELARTGNTILIDPKVRDLLITGDGYQKSYIGANLRGANLISANLSYADLKAADISEATLQAACLDWANLTEIQAIGTDFTYAQITGCSLENWNIDVTTKLNDVESRFVYLLEHPKPNTDDRERRPSSGEFQPGEFTKLFEEVLNTVDLIFRNGIDWQAFMSSFKQVQVENEDTELNIQSIENKGDGVVVVKVSVPEETGKEKIHSEFVQIYDDTVKKLEKKYQAQLEGKEGQIAIYRQQNENMMSFLNNIVPSQLSTPPNKIKREKLVVIGFSNGDLDRGFAAVRTQIWSDGNPLPITFLAKLPPQTEIARQYQQWHDRYKVFREYYRVRGLMPRITPKNNEPTNISEIDLVKTKRDFEELARNLAASLNHWLNSPDFIRIQNQLRMQLNPSNRVRLVIETEDIKMRRLPWHRWDFFRDYPLAEVALSNPEGNRVQKLIPAREQIRILAILGNDKGINVEADRKFLESLPDAETVFLVKPNRQQLDKYLWDEKGWDIFCFSGHSESDADGKTGHFDLNNEETLAIEELENALKAAIEKGLQLAIFNSCDGLGLGRQLADLHVPQIIVMREPVPDTVAQEFLKNFLNLFASGKSLYVSVRQSREMLQGMEDKFPCASWLPVIYQNQAEVPKTWQEFGYKSQPNFEDLLARLQEAIEAETALTAEDKTDALEQVRLLGELGASPPEESKRLVKLAIRMLRGIIGDRPEATMMAEALENLVFVYLFPGGYVN